MIIINAKEKSINVSISSQYTVEFIISHMRYIINDKFNKFVIYSIKY